MALSLAEEGTRRGRLPVSRRCVGITFGGSVIACQRQLHTAAAAATTTSVSPPPPSSLSPSRFTKGLAAIRPRKRTRLNEARPTRLSSIREADDATTTVLQRPVTSRCGGGMRACARENAKASAFPHTHQLVWECCCRRRATPGGLLAALTVHHQTCTCLHMRNLRPLTFFFRDILVHLRLFATQTILHKKLIFF